MLVFWEQRLVFLATPKAGSTAIEAALDGMASITILRPPEAKHTTAQRYRRFLGPYLQAATKEEFEVVALMREPLDWLASWYRFRRREELTDTTRTTRGLGFDRFVQDYLSDPRPAHADVGSQARFLTLADGELGVDRLFAYERIDRFVAFLEDRLDCEIILPTLNVSPEAELDISGETIARHRTATATDYALWESLRDG